MVGSRPYPECNPESPRKDFLDKTYPSDRAGQRLDSTKDLSLIFPTLSLPIKLLGDLNMYTNVLGSP